MNHAPFWPFETSSDPLQGVKLVFRRRGDVWRSQNPDYDGWADDIDEQYCVELAVYKDFEIEVSRDGDDFYVCVSWRNSARFWQNRMSSREECYEWAECRLRGVIPEVNAIQEISDSLEEGLYLLQQEHPQNHEVPGNWSIVRLTKEHGVAVIWRFGWERSDPIETVNYKSLTKITLTAPDGTMVN